MNRPSLTRASLPIVFALVAVSPPSRATPPPTNERAPTPAVGPDAIKEHVARAEKARDAKRWTDAVAAYSAALDEAQRQNMTGDETAPILLELGMCELAIARYNDAADHLHRVLIYDRNLTDRQRERRMDGFKRAAAHVATLILAVNPRDARISVDGKPIGRNADGYVLFLEPGDHTVRAHLHDHSDAEQSTTIPRGTKAKISMRLSQRPPSVPAPAAILPTASPSPNVSRDAATPEPRNFTPWSLAVGAMPILTYGAEPGFGAGASIDVDARYGLISSTFAMRLTGAQNIAGDAAVRTWRGGFVLGLCGNMGPLSLCGLGGMARIVAMRDPRIKLIEEQNPVAGSIGIRPGVEWRIAERFAFRAYGEISATLGQPSVWLDGDNYWTAPPVSGVVGVGFLIPWRLTGDAPKASASLGLSREGM